MRPALDLDPVGQVVGVGVGIVEEAAVLEQQAAGPRARRVAAVPAGRRRPGQALDAGDRPGDMLALLRLAQPVVVDPAPAMAGEAAAESGRAPWRERVR